MEKRTKDFVVKCLWVAFILFILRCLICKFTSLYDFFGAAGEVITVTGIIMGLYSRVLWKYNPLEDVPKLMGEYKGIIEYCYDGVTSQKETSVSIKQTLFAIKLTNTTNEITSNTITGELVYENGEYILYYTYITNPRSKYSKNNPIQYGTCRFITSNKNKLVGTYWTSRKTIGDIELQKIKNIHNK